MCETDLGVFINDKLNLSWQGDTVANIAIVTSGCLNKNQDSTSNSPVLVHRGNISYDNQLVGKREKPGVTSSLPSHFIGSASKTQWAGSVTYQKVGINPSQPLFPQDSIKHQGGKNYHVSKPALKQSTQEGDTHPTS